LIPGSLIWNYGRNALRTAAPIEPGQALAELAKLQEDPDAYLQDHYRNTLLSIPIGDALYASPGHLLSYKASDGTEYYFRRVPNDLYQAIRRDQLAAGIDVSRGIFVAETIEINGEQREIIVEIRPPHRNEALRNSNLTIQFEKPNPNLPFSYAARVTGQHGPDEGWNLTLGGEAFVLRPYELPVNWALEVDRSRLTASLRSNFNVNFMRFAASFSPLTVNPTGAENITSPNSFLSGNRITVGNSRISFHWGLRIRGQASDWHLNPISSSPPPSVTARSVMMNSELTVATDFLRFQRGEASATLGGYCDLFSWNVLDFRFNTRQGPSLNDIGGSSGCALVIATTGTPSPLDPIARHYTTPPLDWTTVLNLGGGPNNPRAGSYSPQT
jgi:hypothetical protein